MKKLILSRSTVLLLIALTLAAVITAGVVPQAFITDDAALASWRTAHPALSAAADALGLFHVFSSPGFAVILLLSLLSLAVSTSEQARVAWRQTFSSSVPASGVELQLPLQSAEAAGILGRRGYLRLGRGNALRLVRHPWGYWGNVLLHCGMVVTIAASLWIALTQQRGMLHLAEGESYQPGQPWLGAEQGLLAGKLVLPEGVRLERVEVRFADNGAIERLASTLSFLSRGRTETATVEVNSILARGGIRIYQGTSFGHAFYLETIHPDGRRETFLLPMQHPVKADRPSYFDFTDLLGPGRTLRAKYFADAERRTLTGGSPLLVLRLDRDGAQLGQLPMRVGEEGAIGPYRFRLAAASRWGQLSFVKLTGIPVVFFGFFLILLGGVLHYFTPPREIVIEGAGSGCRLRWRAVRFADFYMEEFAQLARDLGSGGKDG